MAEVKILIEGYTSAESDDESTCPTMTLVRDENIVMITDPGTMKDQKLLIDALKKERLSVGDINVECITHSHMDHYRNIGMFPKAKALDYWGLWDGDKVEDWREDFSENIQIIKTPGHNYDGITLLVKTEKGIIAICGDIFWKENYPEDDSYASDKEKLQESRKKLLELADYIVPGHGKMFRVTK